MNDNCFFAWRDITFFEKPPNLPILTCFTEISQNRGNLFKLEKYKMQLVQIMHKMIELTDEYQKKAQKSGENNI